MAVHATSVGVDADKIDEARDGIDPKLELIALITAQFAIATENQC